MGIEAAKAKSERVVENESAPELVGDPSIEAIDPVTSEDEAAVAGAETADAMADAADPGSETDLLVALANAMHDAAAARRTRILEAVEHRRAAYVQSIRERGTAEAEAFREEADCDVVGIQSWADAEISRIHSERERRHEARKRELEALIDRHDAQVDWEIEAIEDAVTGHRNDLEIFFGRLDAESDVTMLATLAQDVPQLPDLEAISADARARAEVGKAAQTGPAVATFAGVQPSPVRSETAGPAPDLDDEDDFVDEDRLIGVMDPAAHGRSVTAEEPAVAGREPEVQASESGPLETAAAERSSPGTLLQAISALRPSTSWLKPGNGSERDDTTAE